MRIKIVPIIYEIPIIVEVLPIRKVHVIVDDQAKTGYVFCRYVFPSEEWGIIICPSIVLGR